MKHLIVTTAIALGIMVAGPALANAPAEHAAAPATDHKAHAFTCPTCHHGADAAGTCGTCHVALVPAAEAAHPAPADHGHDAKAAPAHDAHPAPAADHGHH